MGCVRKLKIYAFFFDAVDGDEENSDKNIIFTPMNFDVVATVSLLVKSLHWKLKLVFSIVWSVFIKNEFFSNC